MKKDRFILIDGNPLIYRAFFSPGYKSLKTSLGKSSGEFYGFLKIFSALKYKFRDSNFIFAFDSGDSWRNTFFKEYKTHSRNEKPQEFLSQFLDIKKFLSSMGYKIVTCELLEADDLISMMAYSCVKSHYDCVIVSSDRDFFQLVGKGVIVYDDKAKRFFGAEEVYEHFSVYPNRVAAFKAIVGDTSDKIPGVRKGLGKKTALKILDDIKIKLSEEEYRTFRRNYKLIKLPKTIEEIPSEVSIDGALLKILSLNFDESNLSIDYEIAKKMLEDYECNALNVNDFLLKLE